MFSKIKDFVSNFFSSRIRVLTTLMILFSAILIGRLFVLQIVNGASYQENYNLKIEKTETIEASRGNIYDRNGNLLAYNKLANSITITDSGSYDTTAEKNETLNSQLYEIIINIEENGDSIDNSFGITLTSSGNYEFSSTSQTTINRFRADVFGYSSADDLTYNEDLGLDEAEATAEQIMDYLMGEDRYDISTSYEEEYRYKICVVRYAMAQNSYQKYISTTIASDVSDESVAYIKENINDFIGVDIEETSLREYVDSEYFANIIGYTGTISTEEYEEAVAEDDTVERTDVVGKSGIEQVMNDELSGTKGSQTVYVDKVGNVLSVSEQTDSVAGNDVYLSIDKDLQIAAYEALENEIASILYSKIINAKTYDADDDDDIYIPVYDVYYAFIDNGLIDLDAFESEDASDTEKEVLAAYESKIATVLTTLESQLSSTSPTVYSSLTDEYQEYSTYIVTTLKSLGVIDTDAIDSSDEMQQLWTSESLSVNEYLQYCIEQNWVDVTSYTTESRYSDTEELYSDLVNYILEYLSTDDEFEVLVYKYLLLEDGITGRQLCVILYEQGYLEEDEETKNALLSGSLTAYSFVMNAIETKLITPGELGLDPCSGSAVVIDTNTGEVLALVSYPGYDNNKLANTVDSSYYNYLNTSNASPLYNHATQERTAPGSTFKIVTATAALAENLITTSTTITDEGVFDKVSNNPRCWIYTSSHSTHGTINLSEAIRDSCNYFFYELGYQLAGGSNYNDETGISKIQEYASMYGLNSKTGIEIDETTSTIATEYPVMAAIGQSDNNITTIALARYVTAIATEGTVYNLTLLDHVEDSTTGETTATYSPEVINQITCLDSLDWSSIHLGMREVVENQSAFDDVSYEAAGKTGTAQQDTTRPNHALFIGYAPYDEPEIAVAVRIAYGYSSSNAASVAADIMSYYFGDITIDDILNTDITGDSTSNSFSD